ncbi:proto-oncogene tyrosine-protein kinase receptor Ret-like, partial [Diadema antillarum]|uniref:proto-oncogene tyrosine-protein kinase receptor Ret-like n=1 Tax=Diadema antillarum TaxID=105358 RepID=UPI003A8A2B91
APFLNPSLSDSQVYGLQTRAVNLTCAWSGFPPPFITWTLNGRSVTRRAKRKYLDGISTLSLTPLATDFGTYRCHASNKLGRSSHAITLRRARPPSAPLRVRTGAISQTSVQIIVEPPSTEIRGFPVLFYHVVYQETAPVNLRTDSPLQGGQQRQPGHTERQPASSGNTFQEQQLRQQNQQPYVARQENSRRFNIGSNIELTGLHPGKTYAVRVAAGNEVGVGNFSEIQVSTAAGPSAPVMPTGTSTPALSPARPARTSIAPASYPTPGTSVNPSTRPTPNMDPGVRARRPESSRPSTPFPTLPEGGKKKKKGMSPFPIIVGAILAMFLGGLLIFFASSMPLFRWQKRRQRNPPDEMEEELYRFSGSIYSESSSLQMRPVSVVIMHYDSGIHSGSMGKEFEFPRERLVIGAVIGTGSFGKVVRGDAEGIIKPSAKTVVAIKMLKEDATGLDHQDLLKELAVMKLLKPHPNIVTLFGCCTKDGYESPLIIMEYLPNGNLLSHLRSSRQRVEDFEMHRTSMRTTLSPTDLIRYAYEIANGMAYLASMMCIHRDLAARNILLSRDGVCKLSDFGLARDVMNGGVYQRKTQGRVPIRWMALESLLDNVYTIQSDIWSFGVLMWEIVTIGSYPYPGVPSKKLIKDLQKGFRMPRPEHCSEDIYTIMLECWREEQSQRPTFEQLRTRLETILIESGNYLVLDDFDERLYEYTYDGNSTPDE